MNKMPLREFPQLRQGGHYNDEKIKSQRYFECVVLGFAPLLLGASAAVASQNNDNAHTMRTRRCLTKSTQSNQARKRPVNLTLNENLVSRPKGMMANLFGVVVQAWNKFNEQSGLFVDERPTL